MEQESMSTTATRKSKPESEAPAVPITFDEINRRKVRERVEAYREIVGKHVMGGTLTVSDMEQAAELLEQLGLPQYTFDRNVDAVRRFKVTREKHDAAADAAPGHAERAEKLAAEIKVMEGRLHAMREEHRIASNRIGKASAYITSMAQMQHDHPIVLADLETAVRIRIEELDRRKQAGGAA